MSEANNNARLSYMEMNSDNTQPTGPAASAALKLQLATSMTKYTNLKQV